MKIDLEIMKTIFNVLIDSPDVFIKTQNSPMLYPTRTRFTFTFC